MNTNPGIIGTKLGSTQFFEDNGNVMRVTAIHAGSCVVVGKRSVEKDGYSALCLGLGERREKKVAKAQKTIFEAAGVKAPQVIREIRLSETELEHYSVGQELSVADIFKEGQFVDVVGTSKGRGFSGVMKRHGFSGAATDTHGTHEYRRHGGSIGMNMTPGRTFKNQRMPGQYGNTRVTLLNLRIAKILADENVVMVEGAVPGPRNGLVTVRGAVKKKQAFGHPQPAQSAQAEAAGSEGDSDASAAEQA